MSATSLRTTKILFTIAIASFVVMVSLLVMARVPPAPAEAGALKTWFAGTIPYKMGYARIDVVEFEHTCLYIVATSDGVATSTAPKTVPSYPPGFVPDNPTAASGCR